MHRKTRRRRGGKSPFGGVILPMEDVRKLSQKIKHAEATHLKELEKGFDETLEDLYEDEN